MTIYERYLELLEVPSIKKTLALGTSLLYWEQDEEYPEIPDEKEHCKEFDSDNSSFIIQSHLLTDARGIYIPRDFASFENWEGIDQEQRENLSDPENEGYWETWEEVLGSAHISVNGMEYQLHQDGDLWAIHYIE